MKKLLGVLFVLCIFLPSFVKADGMPFYPPLYPINETEQKAVIWHENGQETLILSFEFQGNAKDFGWAVPTPSKPTVSQGSDELFTALAQLTESASGIVEPMSLMMGSSNLLEEKSVEVVETKEVGIYKINVLRADDPNALYDWLKKNKYQYPEKGKYLLDEYIQKGWYFTVCQVRPGVSPEAELATGHASPLKLVFSSENIIYPLKISSLASYSSFDSPTYILNQKAGVNISSQLVDINLYIFSNHKKDVPGFTTSYAAWVKPDKIKKLAYEDGKFWQDPGKKMFLTKLYRQMLPSEMSDDLILRDADNNKAVGGHVFQWISLLIGVIWSFVILTVFVFSPIGLGFLICAIYGFFTKNRTVRIILWVIQGLAFLFTSFGIISSAYFLSTYLPNSYYVLSYPVELWLPMVIMVFIIYVAMAALMIIEAKKQKQSLLV